MTRSLTLATATTIALAALACEEDKKEPAKTAAAPPPPPVATPEKKPEPPPEPKAEEKKPEQSPLQKCCSALARGGFSTPGPSRQLFMKGAAACREAAEKKQSLAQAKAAIKKALGKAAMPPDCG